MNKAADFPEALATFLAQALEAAGVGTTRAYDVAVGAVESARQHWGGASIYLPRGPSRRHLKRDAEIVRGREAGESCAELARRFDLSEIRVRQILASRVRTSAVTTQPADNDAP